MVIRQRPVSYTKHPFFIAAGMINWCEAEIWDPGEDVLFKYCIERTLFFQNLVTEDRYLK